MNTPTKMIENTRAIQELQRKASEKLAEMHIELFDNFDELVPVPRKSSATKKDTVA